MFCEQSAGAGHRTAPQRDQWRAKVRASIGPRSSRSRTAESSDTSAYVWESKACGPPLDLRLTVAERRGLPEHRAECDEPLRASADRADVDSGSPRQRQRRQGQANKGPKVGHPRAAVAHRWQGRKRYGAGCGDGDGPDQASRPTSDTSCSRRRAHLAPSGHAPVEHGLVVLPLDRQRGESRWRRRGQSFCVVDLYCELRLRTSLARSRRSER